MATIHAAPDIQSRRLANLPLRDLRDKGRYMWRDVEREAEGLGIPFCRPTTFPRNSVPAAKIAMLGTQNGG
jgi:2-hydroxychromene-2-carboxylate isomerase